MLWKDKAWFFSGIVAVEVNVNTKVNTPPPALPELSDTHKTKSVVWASCLSEREPLKGKRTNTLR